MTTLSASKQSPAKWARSQLHQALYSGKLKKPTSCSKCKRHFIRPNLLHGHHEDYEKPLDVIWLCASCHMSLHHKAADPDLDTALDELVAAQPSGISRRALVRSILGRVTAAYKASRDPLAWMKIGPDPVKAPAA